MKRQFPKNGIFFSCLMFLVLLTSLTSSALMALAPDKRITQYTIQKWNMESGLPGNNIYALGQTRDGYLWIGTQDGLVRFDGLNFRVFTNENHFPLKDHEIKALCQDGKGALWIGTRSGGLARYKDGQFTAYPVDQHNTLDNISAIEEDRWGNLWIGSFSRGLTCFSDGAFISYTVGNKANTKSNLPHNRVMSIHKDSGGDLWVVTVTGIVKLLQPGIFESHVSHGELPYPQTACFYKKETGELRVGTVGGGLYRLQNGTFTAYSIDPRSPHRTITCLYEDSMNNLWIGTDDGRLTRMSNGIFSTLPFGDEIAAGYVSSIYEDREGSLWVGILDKGLYQIRDSKFTTTTTAEGLLDNDILCIHEDRTGNLLVGTHKGLNRLNLKTRTLTHEPGLTNQPAVCLAEDPAGTLWVGTGTGLHRFKDGESTTFTKKDGLADNKIESLLSDRRGNTWVGTQNGLHRFDAAQNRFTLLTGQNAPQAGHSIAFIFEDARGRIRIGTDRGLYSLKNGDVGTLKPVPGMENDAFHSIHEDAGGTSWFGTNRGLVRFNEPEKQIYDRQSGLVENHIYSILEDDGGSLWLAGRNGISRVGKKELEDFARGTIPALQPEWFNEKDGMKSRWCTARSCKTRDGRLWFATTAGMTMIDPNRVKRNQVPPPVFIEKFMVDGKPVPHPAVGQIKVAPGTKRWDFFYTAVSFINPQQVKFKLKLEGYDRNWVDRENFKNTTYTSLSPGHYTFRVIAQNSDGVWNPTGASIAFHLRPHWYKTWWALSLYVLTGLLGIFLFVEWRSSRLAKAKKQLEQTVKERTLELSEKNLQLHDQSEKLQEMDRVKSRFFANISHEFRTPLTLIMGPLEHILSQYRDIDLKQKVKLMLRNSRRLLDLINQLLDLSRLDGGRMALRAVRQDIAPFIKGIAHSFDSLALEKKLTLTVEVPAENIHLYYDAEKMEKVLCNLLFNSVKFTPPGGGISVILRVNPAPSPGVLEISVRDTGIGIPAEKLEHIFDRFYQVEGTGDYSHKGTGIGLSLAKELVTLHHGEISVHSGEGRGSEFIIRLPMGDAHLAPGEIADATESSVKSGETATGPAPTIPGLTDEAYHDDRDDQTGSPVHIPVPEAGVEAEKGEKEIILVVEDNADVREYIRGALGAGYITVEAKNGDEGIEKAKEIIPDLVICDIMMPGKDGYEVCKELKSLESTSHIPVILLTARAGEESVVRGLETGADDYITKPFSTRILTARINNLIELRRQLQDNLKRELSLQPVKTSVSTIDRQFIDKLQHILEKNLSDEDFGVEELASKLSMSGSTLYRKLHALTGEGPKVYIRSYRLKRAVQLLKSGFGNVTDVAYEVGFASSAYFTKCFREKFHCVPSDYLGTESKE